MSMNPEEDDYSHISDEDTMGEDVNSAEFNADSTSANTEELTDMSGVLSQKSPAENNISSQNTKAERNKEVSQKEIQENESHEDKLEDVKAKDNTIETEKNDSTRKDAINALLNADFITGVPKNKIKGVITFTTNPLVKKLYSVGKWVLIFALGFYLAYYTISGAYNSKKIAMAPLANYALCDMKEAVQARTMLYRGIVNAQKSIVAVLPLTEGLDPEIYKVLGTKARSGVQVVLIMSSQDPSYATVRRYMDYYTSRKALIAAIPTRFNYTVFALDGTYIMETQVPLSASFGKAPAHGNLTIYKDAQRVKRTQTELAKLQKVFQK